MERDISRPDRRGAEHVECNRQFWDSMADDWVASGERNWRLSEPTWGVWGIPERELALLPEEMGGMAAVELGCGTAYVSGWMARRGATVTGIDTSRAQLQTAERLMREHRVELTLTLASAEALPYPDDSFDFAISEYGAAIWCDPERWIPEARRVLRPGGTLTFLGTHPLAIVCSPYSGADSDERLHRPYFGMGMIDWREVEVDPGGVEFNLTISDWFALFRRTRFEVLEYRELQAPQTAREHSFSIPVEWAKQWPSEQLWKLRKR